MDSYTITFGLLLFITFYSFRSYLVNQWYSGLTVYHLITWQIGFIGLMPKKIPYLHADMTVVISKWSWKEKFKCPIPSDWQFTKIWFFGTIGPTMHCSRQTRTLEWALLPLSVTSRVAWKLKLFHISIGKLVTCFCLQILTIDGAAIAVFILWTKDSWFPIEDSLNY